MWCCKLGRYGELRCCGDGFKIGYGDDANPNCSNASQKVMVRQAKTFRESQKVMVMKVDVIEGKTQWVCKQRHHGDARSSTMLQTLPLCARQAKKREKNGS